MNLAEPEPRLSPPHKPAPPRRPLVKRLVMLLRRGHLYLGLFLFPWAILYGVTAFLFNHPTAFSDQPTASFSARTLVETPLATLPSPDTIAAEVVGGLNALHQPNPPYAVAGPARFSGRDFAFATVKAPGQTVSVLMDLKNGGGTVRATPTREQPEPERAPFAVGNKVKNPGRSAAESGSGLTLENSIIPHIKATVPVLLARTGFPTGEVTVTSTPDVTFPVTADGRTWFATFNPLTGAINGTSADAKPETQLSWRRFLLRLHTAHGYPGETNGRWFWALIVDAMAFTMCFWGLTGLVMWWQIKSTRKLGAVVLVLSAVAATALGFAMHTVMRS